jgi:hypothetical protein
MRKLVAGLTIALGASLAWGGIAAACGSLVADNGAVNLVRTSTLAAYHDGVEHYVTSFEFAGAQGKFGSIVPLPDRPSLVERAGDWTLQRLQLEVQPPLLEAAPTTAAREEAADGVEVIDEVQIDSLRVRTLRGGGRAVATWARAEGFDLSNDADDVLEFYSDRSPYFLAATFDPTIAAEDGFASGDGIPVHVAIPTDDPWVPLRILGTGKPGREIVRADVFLLTDDEPSLLRGEGVEINRSERASDDLLDDLRSDKNSSWVPRESWFTHLTVSTATRDLDFDLAIDADGGAPSSVDYDNTHRWFFGEQ